MVNLRTDQAPARSEIGWAAACTLVAILVVELFAAPGFAWATEAAAGAALPQPAVGPAPTTPNASAANPVLGAPAPSRWARVPAWQKILGVGATLVGLAAVGTGAYLLWLDGQNACAPAKDKTSLSACAFRHPTALPGWLLMAGGTAASLGGVTFLLLPPIGESRGRAVAGLAVSARF
jgi:hypothetical protein